LITRSLFLSPFLSPLRCLVSALEGRIEEGSGTRHSASVSVTSVFRSAQWISAVNSHGKSS